MRLGFVVNDLWAEKDSYTTSRIAVAALREGHEIWMASVEDSMPRSSLLTTGMPHGRPSITWPASSPAWVEPRLPIH